MPAETLAGFRLVRKLGSGSRAEVFLGHAGTGSPRTAAIKVFHTSTTSESIAAEVRALSAASHAHTVALRDLSTGEDGRPVLVLERLELGSLGHLLTTRATLSAGEAVTVLAPLAAAVGAIHGSGVAHGRITAARVLFRESGAPVLCGFGHATSGEEGVEADNRALALLAEGVLERVDGTGSLRDWLASLVRFPRGFSEQLSARVFDLAAAEPVRFDADPVGTELVPARALGARSPVIEPVELEPAQTQMAQAQVAQTQMAQTELDPTPIARLRMFLQLYQARIPERFRRPRYLAIAAGALTLVIAIAVVPSGEPAAVPVAPTAASSVPALDDDPVEAFGILVATRNECVRDLSVLCLDAVLQQGSAAMDDDIALIQSIEKGAGGEAVLEARNVILEERMGDAALVGYTGINGQPASALLVKGEAGWRIRSYLSG